jgi:hypothetical protein
MVTSVSAEWPFPVKASKFYIDQESNHFPVILNQSNAGNKTSCDLKGGHAKCQCRLVNEVVDEKGSPHKKEWWVDTFKKETAEDISKKVKTSVVSKK